MYYFIINPKSKSGQAMDLWRNIKKELEIKKSIHSYVKSISRIGLSHTSGEEYRHHSMDYRYVFTRYPGHITEIMKRLTASKKPKHIVIIGGDGSFNEAINGLKNPYLHRISFLPSGSGNDLARSLNLPDQPKKLLAKILDAEKNNTISLDLGSSCFYQNGKRKNRLFAISSGIGFDAAICEDINQSRLKKLLNQLHIGKLAYPLIGIKQLFLWKPQQALLYIDEKQEPMILNRFLFLSAHIHPSEGGGFPFCPDADYQDGLLDLCVVSDITRGKALTLIPLAKQGRHVGQPGIQIIRCKKARIELEYPVPVHTDGEVSCHSKVLDISTYPEKIHII